METDQEKAEDKSEEKKEKEEESKKEDKQEKEEVCNLYLNLKHSAHLSNQGIVCHIYLIYS